MKSRLLYTLGILGALASLARAEEWTASVAKTVDTSRLGLAKPLQQALGQVLQSTNTLKVRMSDYQFSSVTQNEVTKGFKKSEGELLSFVHIDERNVAVYLFSRMQPTQFIVASKPIADSVEHIGNTAYIEEQFVEAVNEALADFNAGKFQPLPGSDTADVASLDEGTQRRRAEEARILYREMASLDRSNWFMGANVGMTKFSQVDAAGQITPLSTVDFGVSIGRNIGPRFAVEAGLDVFTHLFSHADLRYHVPFLEKFVSLSVLAGVGTVLAQVTRRQFDQNSDQLVGGIVAGPGLAFDIPLLGTTVRAEARYYYGDKSVMIATYGIILPF